MGSTTGLPDSVRSPIPQVGTEGRATHLKVPIEKMGVATLMKRCSCSEPLRFCWSPMTETYFPSSLGVVIWS